MARVWQCVVMVCVVVVSVVYGEPQDLGRPVDDPRGLKYGTDISFKGVLRNRLRLQNRHNHPTHMIMAPRMLRPGAVYRCVVSILHLDYPVDVRASLQKDGVEIASAKQDVIKGYPETLLLQIPRTSVNGHYRLRLEGNVPGTIGGTVFLNDTRLHFSTRFLTILIQTNRPVYTGDQIVRFRIILLTTELKAYDDPVDVYILDPDGYVMRRWPSRPTNVGVVSMSFTLPFLPKVGWWGIKALVNGQEEIKRIKVDKWYTPRFEVKLFMPKYFLETDEAVTGEVGGEFGNDKGAYGNATLKLFVRNKNHKDWIYVMQQEFVPLDSEDEYSFPMEEISKKVPVLDGSEVRIEAEITETFTMITEKGFSTAKIINSSVNCRFLGSPPYVFKPGMPFEASIAVSYHDLQPLGVEKLHSSKLVVKAEALSESGARQIIYKVEIPQVNAEEEENEFLEASWLYNKRLQTILAKDPTYKVEDYDPKIGIDPDTGARYLTENELVEKKLEVFLRNEEFQKYREKGVFHFKVDVPDKTAGIALTASYQDDMGSVAAASAQAIAYYSSKKQYIGVETSSKSVTVGEFVVFHVRSNFNMDSFHYLIMSKEMILYAAKEVLERTSRASVKTISVPVSSEMAPAFKIVVYHLTHNDEIISDSQTVPVDGISRHKVKLNINQHKDHSIRSVELGTYSTPGAFYGISGVREFTYAMRGGNELSHASVLNALHEFANSTRSIHKMTWRYREGYQPEEVEYYTAGNYGPDANRTFDFSGIVVFTDANVGVIPGYAESKCNSTDGYSRCLMGGCYPSRKRCDGVHDCADGYDEVDCFDPLADRELEFRVNRYAKFSDFYDTEDGDWLWLDINIGHKGHEQNDIELPKVDDPYVLNAFSVSKEYGFGLIDFPQKYSAMPIMYISLEMPDSCRRGEQIGMRIMVFNNLPQEMMILLVLHGADTHRFVLVEEHGVVDFYRPRTKAGDHQHLVSVNAESSMEIIFPIVATIDQGEIELTVSALTQVGKDEETATLMVEPEGATIDRHTSILLDLKNRAVVYEYMDIIVEESFVIPLDIRRRFVAGSPRGHVSICGDVVGPSFPNGGPVDSVQMLRKELRGTEPSTFNFGANLWTLHYLRLTNQLDYAEVRDVFDQLNVELAAIIYRFGADGSFKMWDTAGPSVWLTAWTTRILQHAQFQDWENILFIEPRIISKAIEWLVKWQNPVTGAFRETPSYEKIPLDKKASGYSYGARERGPKNITLTAQCLITLEITISSLQGRVRGQANSARSQAIRYLERELKTLYDPYELAIVAYALSKANSVEKEAAFNALDRLKREENGLVYWSRAPVKANTRVYENNQRNLLQPKYEEEWDSHAVESTSYALLVYLIRDGVNIIQERIVEWLNAMRMHDGGFISTVDTLVAMQALTEYSYRARLRDITDMRVTVEATGEVGRATNLVSISNTSVSKMNLIPIHNVWGLVNVMAHGAGQAILQLDVSYGVDWTPLRKRPPVDAFELEVREYYSMFGNKSHCSIQVCARWINEKESDQSSATVIEIEVPTGYVAFQIELEKSIRDAQAKKTFPSLRDVIGGHGDVFAKKTVWFFDYIPANRSCFTYQMKRWYPVANLTNVRMATIYELYQPERFQMVMFNSTVNSLDICEVCGSYQCPYCPIYSSSPSLNLPPVGVLLAVAIFNYISQVFPVSLPIFSLVFRRSVFER